ncbi:MAG: PIN domain-containing protein [Acidobacteria bacterium]|nr:PIN domain-containing protein [Acidobacteriota bacterium]MCW5970663.1 PIN domain-containing protein [Blastocatellales bacterium]
MSYLLDTGFAVEFLNRDDKKHRDVSLVMQGVGEPIIFPVPAITETAYLLMRDAGMEIATHFIAAVGFSDLILECPEPTDYRRAAEIMRQYADSQIDFVDALIVAIAERLNITSILTLDQRDFRLIRPRHCAAFEILP